MIDNRTQLQLKYHYTLKAQVGAALEAHHACVFVPPSPIDIVYHYSLNEWRRIVII